MIKKLFVFTIAVCCFYGASAQVSLGIRGGLNYSGITNTSSIFSDFSYKPGIHFGGVADIELKHGFHIRPEILFSSKGYREVFYSGPDFNSMAPADFQERIHYLEIPVYLAHHSQVGAGELITNIGPYLGIALAGNYRGANSQYDGGIKFKNKATATEINELYTEEGKFVSKRTDYGLAAGIGYRLNRFMFNGTYSFSIASLNVEIDYEQMDEPFWVNEQRYKVYQLSAIYFLKAQNN
jgi:hypothetical protein